MRTFRSFFMISLGLFLFLFLARFIVLAFVAAIFLTFIAFVVRAIRHHSWGTEESDWDEHRYRLSPYRQKEEPLFFEREKESTFDWNPEYRTIQVH
ncbi:MAG: hypothetical protein HKN76_11300 [Saprospiraceae bacterium]|nr:hypothetical protein [Saprospiraceae bacterium]